MRGLREILALVGLAVILLILLLVLENPPAEAPPDRRLFELQGPMIERILVTGPDAAIAATRTADGWMLESPRHTRGRPERWDELAKILAELRYHRLFLEEAADLSVYGLDSPRRVVTFFDRQGNAHKLELGLSNPTGDYVYARRGNDPRIYLLDRSRLEAFAVPMSELREDRAIPFDFRRVDGFRVDQPAGRFEFRRRAGEWRLQAPFTAPGATAAIQDWLFRISRWPVADPLDERDPARFRDLFGDPRYRLQIALAEGGSRTLEIGAPARAWGPPETVPAFLPGPGEYFLVTADLAAALDIPYQQLLPTTLLDVNPAEIKGISVDSPGRHWTFFRTPSGEWRWVRQQLSVPLSAHRISEYLGPLVRLPVLAYRPPASDPALYGLAEPAWRIFLDQENGPGVEVAFGHEAEGVVYARRSDFPCILEVDLARWRELSFDPPAWILTEK